MYYIDTSVLLVYTLAKKKEKERYKHMIIISKKLMIIISKIFLI